MKYSKSFERDFNWYLSQRHNFNFDGSYYKDVVYSRDGIDGKKAFFHYDSSGKLLPTKHPNILRNLIKIKGSINLHIKMYSEDRAKGIMPLFVFKELCQEYKAPEWFFNAVEKQKVRWYSKLFPEKINFTIVSEEELKSTRNPAYQYLIP